jgi:hypothetical protein
MALLTIFFFSIAAIAVLHEGWHKFGYNITIGSLISLIFYGLVVRLPDYRKRQRIKNSFARHYRDFREGCIEIMLLAADGTFEAGVPETLIEQDKFKEYFSHPVSSSQDRWSAFLNNLDEYHLQSLITKMEIFRDEISFVLNNTDIPDDEPFEFLKRLSGVIHTMKTATLDYDPTKRLGGFLWSVFAGFDIING